MLNFNHLLSFNIISFNGRKKLSRQKNATTEIDYSEITFILAQSEDLSQSIPMILTHVSCQQFLQNFDSLFILLPGKEEKYIIHSADNIESNIQVINHLKSLQINAMQNSHKQFIQNINDYRLILYPIKNEELERMAYLVFVFKGDFVNQNQVNVLTHRLKLAIQRGLQLYQQRNSALINAVKQERISQAADLHDSIAQVLSYLKLRASSLTSYLHDLDLGNNTEALKLANEIDNQIGFAHRLTRELITSSRLNFLQTNLSDAIQNTVAEFEQLSGIIFELDNREKEALENTPYQNEILFIIRESLCNLVRHSHASHARIVITKYQDQLKISIEDNGIGIQLGLKRPDSFGLSIMEDRARKINASLLIKNRDEGGACIQLSIPRDSLT